MEHFLYRDTNPVVPLPYSGMLLFWNVGKPGHQGSVGARLPNSCIKGLLLTLSWSAQPRPLAEDAVV